MNVAALFSLAAFTTVTSLGLGLTACVTNANRCLPGFEYSSSYDACLELDAGSDGGPASTIADAGFDSANDGASVGEGGEAGGGSSADLGKTCNGTPDCSGLSNYCLKSPEDPSGPGYCSIPNCTQAECGSAYSCCACAGAAISALQALPDVCVDLSNKPTLVSFGCTCQ